MLTEISLVLPTDAAPKHWSARIDGTTLHQASWTGDGKPQMPSPKLSNGGQLAYDKGHHLLYSSNEYAGFWRVVTGP